MAWVDLADCECKALKAGMAPGRQGLASCLAAHLHRQSSPEHSDQKQVQAPSVRSPSIDHVRYPDHPIDPHHHGWHGKPSRQVSGNVVSHTLIQAIEPLISAVGKCLPSVVTRDCKVLSLEISDLRSNVPEESAGSVRQSLCVERQEGCSRPAACSCSDLPGQGSTAHIRQHLHLAPGHVVDCNCVQLDPYPLPACRPHIPAA